VWTEAERDYYRLGGEDLGICCLCKEPMRVGDAYYLRADMMMFEPTPPFHARCQGKGKRLQAERN